MPEPHQRESDRSIDSSPLSSGLDRCLSKKQRLTQSGLFAETFAQNRKWVGRYMVLWLRSGPSIAIAFTITLQSNLLFNTRSQARLRHKVHEKYKAFFLKHSPSKQKPKANLST